MDCFQENINIFFYEFIQIIFSLDKLFLPVYNNSAI